jgi:thioredoxin reductase (NADPH)
MSNSTKKVIIIGSGPAGYTAAIYAARAAMEPLMFSGIQVGGQLTTTTEVENFPGFEDGIQGPELMMKMKAQAERFGTEIIMKNVDSVDFSKRPFRVTVSGEDYFAENLIIATGASARWLGIDSEEKYKNRGVSGCATCDGLFFRDKNVAVVGGGDTAFEEALYLANICSSVKLIHRRKEFRASKIMQERVFEHEKIEVITDAAIDEVLGDEMRVTGMRLKNTVSGDLTEHDIDGIFIAIGHRPNTDLFKDSLELDEMSYIKTEGGTTKTNIPGVYACGDVQDSYYRQGVVAAGSGAMAAIEVERN